MPRDFLAKHVFIYDDLLTLSFCSKVFFLYFLYSKMVHHFVAFVYCVFLMYIHADLSFCSSPFYTCWRDVPTPMALQN